MRLPIHQVDAFTDCPFCGNPAAVMPLDAWLPDALLLSIAKENNLSETAFFVPEGEGFRIRWFTPRNEVDLCGHATLASAFIILTELQPSWPRVALFSRSGPLAVARDGDRFRLDFPSRPPRSVPVPRGLEAALGARALETWQSRDLVALLDSERTVRELEPDMGAVAALEAFGVVVTAKGESADFVSRFFVPKEGIPEDPVTGSTHCNLVPLWAERLGKTRMRALQVSPRGGELFCELKGDRVDIGGKAVKVLEGVFIL